MEKLKKIIKEYLPYVIIILLVLIIKKTVVSPIKVNGDSMNDTLHDGDVMILDIISYRFKKIKRFDIVVVKVGNEYLIKRVIGLPGEKITYRNNQLYVNERKVKEKFITEDTADFSVIVPKNTYFVLGDNRDNSMDSRVYGAIKKKSILGKTNLILFPFNRLGIKK